MAGRARGGAEHGAAGSGGTAGREFLPGDERRARLSRGSHSDRRSDDSRLALSNGRAARVVSSMPLLHWAMPSKYHSIHRNDLVRAMVAQSEQAFQAITQGNAPEGDRENPGVQRDGALLRQGRERRALTSSFLARELGARGLLCRVCAWCSLRVGEQAPKLAKARYAVLSSKQHKTKQTEAPSNRARPFIVCAARQPTNYATSKPVRRPLLLAKASVSAPCAASCSRTDCRAEHYCRA